MSKTLNKSFNLTIYILNLLIFANIYAQPQSIKILDRFNDYPTNEFGGETGGFYENGSVQTEVISDANAFDKLGKTLVIHYNVTTNNGFSGYYSKPRFKFQVQQNFAKKYFLVFQILVIFWVVDLIYFEQIIFFL